MSDGTAPGIRQNIYLDGLILDVPASSVRWRVARAETVERLLNGYAVIDRPFIFDGAPNVITKFSFDLAFPGIAESDYEAIAAMEARSGFFDLCLWKPIVETFSGDGNTTTFRLLRRIAVEEIDGGFLPPDAATVYATVCKVEGSVDASFDPGTYDSETGATPFTLDTPPAAGVDNVTVFYVPLFYVRVLDPERDFSTPFNEATTLKMEEA